MKILEGGLETVPGYSFAAVECGIKYEHRLDLSMIFSRKPCNAAGVFTTNRIPAAPVRLCRERINNPIHGIIINANNANACTGAEGYAHATALCSEAARRLGVGEDSFLMASTGVIGVQLPVRKMLDSIPRMAETLTPENGKLIPKAIMTTDTFPKACAVSFTTSKGEFHIGGTAKGVGMIAPDMATLLAFLVTDAPIPKPSLDALFRRRIADSFNSVTIDGDMSTNDTAIILSPESEDPLSASDECDSFEEALGYVLSRLAQMLVRDGEGASKYVTVTVSGARTREDARKAAKAIAESLLVKTALFGNDPNWGRIACAAGYSGACMREENLSISINGVPLFTRGSTQAYDRDRLRMSLSEREIDIIVELGEGAAECKYLTTDISYEYVKINAEYTT